MRQTIVVVVLLAMLVGVAGLLATRDFPPPPPKAETDTPAPADVDAGTKPVAEGDAGEAVADKEPEAKTLDRPLRIVATGWELLAPGIIANGGTAPAADGAENLFEGQKIKVSLAPARDIETVEKALARGGAEENGADVAIISLPTYVASYERLRALAPEIFFVAGWSRGREGLAVTDASKLHSPSTRGDLSLRGRKGSPATFMAMFMLDQAGVALDRVRLVEQGEITGPLAPIAAVERSLDSMGDPGRSRRLLMTTADATGLIPFVAVAPRGFIQSHEAALQAWARAWIDGADKLSADVPGSARQIAKEKHAPEVVALLNLLGWLDYADLRDNIQWMGLSGRGLVTIEGLFHRTWRLWRASDILTTPPPASTPLANTVVANLARATPDMVRPSRGLPPRKPDGSRKAEDEVLLVVRLPPGKLNEAALQADIGFLSGIFGRSAMRVAVQRDPRGTNSQKILDAVSERFGVPPSRLIAAKKLKGRNAAVIEVLAAR